MFCWDLSKGSVKVFLFVVLNLFIVRVWVGVIL